MTRLNPGVRFGLGVRYAVSVLNRDGSVAEIRPAKNNLILDTGLDRVANATFAQLFATAAVGTGTTPVKRDSGAIPFTRTGDAVAASAGFFEAGDVGRLFKFDSGEESYITAFTDTQNVTVADSGAVGASEGTVWYVNQTGLAVEVKRSTTYGSDSGDNGTSYAAGTYTYKRTFLFSAEAGSVTYNEIGWSDAGGAGNNLFGRDLISGGIALSAGQQLKVIVELSVALGPAASTSYSNVITGWTQDGDCSLESVPDISFVLPSVTSGGATNDPSKGVLSPHTSGQIKRIVVSTLTDALVAMTQSNIGVSGALATKDTAAAAYVTGSRTRTYSATCGVSEANSAAIRSIILTGASAPRVFRVLLDAAETKDSDHTLTLTFRLSWDRILVN